MCDGIDLGKSPDTEAITMVHIRGGEPHAVFRIDTRRLSAREARKVMKECRKQFSKPITLKDLEKCAT